MHVISTCTNFNITCFDFVRTHEKVDFLIMSTLYYTRNTCTVVTFSHVAYIQCTCPCTCSGTLYRVLQNLYNGKIE